MKIARTSRNVRVIGTVLSLKTFDVCVCVFVWLSHAAIQARVP